MARQISISNEVYVQLTRGKGKRSFSEVIKEAMDAKKRKLAEKNSKNASARLLERMKKGYKLGKITGTREDWHER